MVNRLIANVWDRCNMYSFVELLYNLFPKPKFIDEGFELISRHNGNIQYVGIIEVKDRATGFTDYHSLQPKMSIDEVIKYARKYHKKNRLINIVAVYIENYENRTDLKEVPSYPYK